MRSYLTSFDTVGKYKKVPGSLPTLVSRSEATPLTLLEDTSEIHNALMSDESNIKKGRQIHISIDLSAMSGLILQGWHHWHPSNPHLCKLRRSSASLLSASTGNKEMLETSAVQRCQIRLLCVFFVHSNSSKQRWTYPKKSAQWNTIRTSMIINVQSLSSRTPRRQLCKTFKCDPGTSFAQTQTFRVWNGTVVGCLVGILFCRKADAIIEGVQHLLFSKICFPPAPASIKTAKCEANWPGKMLGKFVLYFSESMSMEFNWILEITKLKKKTPDTCYPAFAWTFWCQKVRCQGPKHVPGEVKEETEGSETIKTHDGETPWISRNPW